MTGAIGYGALVTSKVMPIRQFGAILATCTFGAAVLVMLISPIAMLPPFRMEIPVRYGSRSRVAGFMNRLVLWVYQRPRAIVVTVLAVVLPLACGLVRLTYETNYINCSGPRPASSAITTRSNRGSAASAWWSSSFRSAARSTRTRSPS